MIPRNDEKLYRIVGFEVEPQSIAVDMMTTKQNGDVKQCALSTKGEPQQMELNKDAQNTVKFSFSVQFKPSDIAWASRWDIYLQMSDVHIHWFAICNSVAIVFFLTG
jgi:transmembrane 9 superfamily protein 2/4